VCGDDQHRFRAGNAGSRRLQLGNPNGIDERRCAVAKVEGGHAIAANTRCARAGPRLPPLLLAGGAALRVNSSSITPALYYLWMLDHGLAKLVKRYGRVVVLDGLDLYVDEEPCLRSWPNGAGKTTAVRILTKRFKPDAGPARCGVRRRQDQPDQSDRPGRPVVVGRSDE